MELLLIFQLLRRVPMLLICSHFLFILSLTLSISVSIIIVYTMQTVHAYKLITIVKDSLIFFDVQEGVCLMAKPVYSARDPG